MTKTDFAELKEKLMKLDVMALSAEYIECCKRRQYNGLVRIEDMVKWQFEKDAAIISELIEIIKLQSEALEKYQGKAWRFEERDTHEKTFAAKTCLSETTTRLQKLREGK